MGIKVKAMESGYYITRRRPGDVFEIEKEEDRGKWMGEPDVAIKKKEPMPFTSQVKGTEAGGNIYAPGKSKPWEEPVGESKPDKVVKKKSQGRVKSSKR
jgi:hypothetical protein|tara:strand:+ start:644 stop:940 length:297 start_codon:yes stop_codon:yes gene_type:complete